MICGNCENTNLENASFCSSCGAKLGGLAPPPTPSKQPFPNTASGSPAANSASEAEETTHVVSASQSANAASDPFAGRSHDPLIGRTIERKYRIDLKLGSGGMGAVYRAIRLVIGDEVAVKILHSQQNDPRAGERFRREAQAAARLKHPNAVSIYDFGVTDDALQFLVMELVEGESLRRIIKQQGPLTPSASAEIISQVCAALDEAHGHNIIHRDIKPDNIMVNVRSNGLRVKVLDFGIAKLRDDTAGNLTQTGSILGTPHYMSPEQCLGEELDSRSDIYSLGIVLYEMLTGVVPFNAPISTAVVVQHVNQPPPSLRTRNPGITRSVETAVLHALEKTREARPQTAGALAEELTAAVANSNLIRPSEAADPLSRDASTPTLVVNSDSRAAIQRSAHNRSSERPPTKQGNLTKTVAVTVVATLFLLGLGGLGFRMLFGGRGESANGAPGTSNLSNQTTPSASQPGYLPTAPATQVATAPSPDPAPVNTSLLTSEVRDVLDGWSAAARAHDLDAQMTFYAETVDPYFRRRNVSAAQIRADRAVAYSRYYKLDVQLSNINIVLDQTGTRATATFDKAFAFEGEKHFSGSVSTRLWLTRIGSRWLITAERDLKVHYINK